MPLLIHPTCALQGQLFVRPRKANWDLKRDVVAVPSASPALMCIRMRCVGLIRALLLQEKKLEKLEKRTQRAILDLIQQKLKDQADGAANINLNEAINKGQRQEENED